MGISYLFLMHGRVIVLKYQLSRKRRLVIPLLVSQLNSSHLADHKPTSQPASKRRGRALNATTIIAQAARLSSFQQLSIHTRQSINITKHVQLPPLYSSASETTQPIRAQHRNRKHASSLYVQYTLPSSFSTNTH
jgi:hypothetical protein